MSDNFFKKCHFVKKIFFYLCLNNNVLLNKLNFVLMICNKYSIVLWIELVRYDISSLIHYFSLTVKSVKFD